MYEFPTIQVITEKSSVIVAVFLNLLFIFLVTFHSPKNLGAYKYLMISICVFEVFYAILDWALLPIFHSFGSTFAIFFKIDQFIIPDKFVVELFGSLYCAFFGSSLAIFSIHFVYRFWVISGNPKLSSFQGWKIFLWLLIPLANGLHWSLLAWFVCRPRSSTDDYLRNNALEALDIKLEDVTYIAPYFYEGDENGNVKVYYTSFIGITVDLCSIIASVFCAAYYAIKCYQHLRQKLQDNALSNQFKRIQSQLFHSLVTQTLIPVILMHIPVGMMFVANFLNWNVGSLCRIVSITITLYPALDPIPAILIVKNYRKALSSYIFKGLRRLKRSQIQASS